MSIEHFAPQLSRPSNVEQLARALGIATDIFLHIADNTNPAELYTVHLIPKRANAPTVNTQTTELLGTLALAHYTHDASKYRIVWEATSPSIKRAHKSAAHALTRFFSRPGSNFPHPAAFGYIKGRTTRDNAKRHIGSPNLLSADIKNFFPSITTARVELALEYGGIDRRVCGILARFLTIKGSLPLGLSSSPMIANLVATPLDIEMTKIADELKCRYTRYADDMTFSGSTTLPQKDAIERILQRHNFRLNEAKFRASKRGQRHYVTGLSVADPVAPHAPKKMKRLLRQELYYVRKYGLSDHLTRIGSTGNLQRNVNRLDGMVNYVSSIEPGHARHILSLWREICLTYELKRSFEPREAINLRRAQWFVDESEFMHPQHGKLLAICVVEATLPEQLEAALAKVCADEAGDAFSLSGASVAQNRLHWTEESLSLKEAVVTILGLQPVQAMVALGKLIPGEPYAETYCRLLGRILDTFLRRADDAAVTVVVEKNSSKVSELAIKELIASTFRRLQDNNQRRPLSTPDVQVLPKGGHPSMCAPDFLLGVLGRYAMHSGKGRENVKFFEILRRRFSAIFDECENKVYSERNPFRPW